jgi:hypothetical protein
VDPFPTSAPFRVDQVTAAPLAMTGLFLVMVLAAAAMSWAAVRHRRRFWWGAAGLLFLLVAVFFTLANWGNSDPTKLSHYLPFDLSRVQGEPFWMAVAPLVVRLPYRMAMAHGLVSAGYAAAVMLLARRLDVSAWAGWWALLLCCSPMLRNFFQNGVTRQALATLLLLPVLLWAAGIAPMGRVRTALAALWAGTAHTTFAGILLLGLLPSLLADPAPPAARGVRIAFPRKTWIACLALLAALLLVLGIGAPTFVSKLWSYTQQESFFSRYAVAGAVARLQLAMVVSVVISCWHRRLGWKALLACSRSRQLGCFVLLFLAVQGSVLNGWFPQITSRFADVVGFFLLILWLAWLVRYRCLWAMLPALVVTIEAWMGERLFASVGLGCGRNDAFLCVPDRWPWQVRYGSIP